MRRCAFLSTDNLEDFFVYDDMVKPHLHSLGWEVEDVSWHRKDVDYNRYDLVVVRSTWDYQDDATAFLKCLETIEKSSANLKNPLSVMQWNLSKTYLKSLEIKGVPILPTLWADSFDKNQLETSFGHFDSEEIVVKPLISANADFTYRLSKQNLHESFEELQETFAERPYMIQGFEPSINDPGEFSLFYFAGDFSHAILKTPQDGDFRVQEEHGGSLQSIEPNKDMLALASQTLRALPDYTLYARVDMLKTSRGLEIIEVELIEPSLYFNMDESSALRFAHAINDVKLV